MPRPSAQIEKTIFELELARLETRDPVERERLGAIMEAARAQVADDRASTTELEGRIGGQWISHLPGNDDWLGQALWEAVPQAVFLDLSVEEVWALQRDPVEAEAMALGAAEFLARLPERQREAVHLAFWRQDGFHLSQREAALRMGISQPAFWKLVTKGLASLRRMFAERWDAESVQPG